MTRQHKTFSFHVKAADDELGTIEAYGSVFDVPDYGDDIVRPGAFKRTIQHAKSRIEAGKARFLAVMLYQHDPDRPIGGWTDLQEDDNGLKCKGRIVLETQLGRETYALIKAGVIDQFSIGYDVPSGGATYDKSSGYRELKELRLWEISPVTFAMQPEALLTGVKGASGGAFPLADRNTTWSKSKALQDIQEATGGDWSKAAKYFFWIAKSIPEKEADCKLPFVANVGGTMKAVPQAIISCAGVIQGAMGGADIDDVDGVKKKIAAYYHKMDMSPPWDSSEKSMQEIDNLEHKAGRAISAVNSDKIQAHVDNLRSMAEEHKNAMQKAMQMHIKAINSAADDLATILQGSEAAYGADNGTPDAGQQEGKSASSLIETRAAAPHPSFEDTADDAGLSALLDVLRSANSSSK